MTLRLSATRSLTLIAAQRQMTILRSRSRARFVSTTSPSSKITTTPFRVRPEDALMKMHINALIASASVPNMIYAGLLRLFGSSITPFAKELGVGENLVLKDMKAALYPIWRVDTMFEGRVEADRSTKRNGRRDPYLWVSTREGYVPGNPFAPLSYLSYAVPPLPEDLPTYDPSHDLKQLGDGYDIVPVPFTVSPLGLAKKLRKMIGDRAEWEGIFIDESKIQETLVACYPIMFPIYIAEFEHDQGDEGKRRFNVIMDAHDEVISNCRVSWPPPPQVIQSGRFDKNYFMNPAPFLPMANILLYPPNAPSTGPTTNKLVELYREWMSPAPNSEGRYIPPSPMLSVQEEESGVDWSDVRVQSWNSVEREENGEWIEMALKMHTGIETLEQMTHFSSRQEHPEEIKGLVIRTKNAGNGGPLIERRSISDMQAQLSKDVESMKKDYEKLKPSWLGELEKARESLKK